MIVLPTQATTKPPRHVSLLSRNMICTITTIVNRTVSLAMLWIAASGTISNHPRHWQVEAVTASPHTFVVNQDNEDIVLKIKGDEDDHWLTNQHDFTVIRDDQGKYKFAKLSLDKERLEPSSEKVGNSRPKHTKKKDLRPPKKKEHKKSKDNRNESVLYDESTAMSSSAMATGPKGSVRGRSGCDRNSCWAGTDGLPLTDGLDASGLATAVTSESNHRRTIGASKSIGTLKNLVVLLKFQDHLYRDVPSREDIGVLMNSEEVHPDLAPTGSLKMLYQENSYGQLTIESEVTDWILLNNTEAYYAGGKAGLGENRSFHEALRYALDVLEADGFAFGDFDSDGDNRIDSIAFLTSGYGAEWGSEDAAGASFEDRIWSHKWSISGGWKSARTGVHISDYFVSPSLWATSGNKIGRVGVIAHEIGHFLDLPDLYDTDSSGNGLGFFCLMSNSWGSDGTQLNPPALSAWTKIQLGWATPRSPSIGVENRISRSEGYPTRQAPDQFYKIGDGVFGFPRGEYLLLEFRQAELPIGGIAIYHIDERQKDFNKEGFPGQIDGGIKWPYNGNHYKVALAPADELYELEKSINQGNSSDLYGIGQSLLPSKDSNGPFPNTDSYQNGLVRRTDTRICITSDINEPYMTFLFADDNPIQPWIPQLSENFENRVSNAISFESKAKVVQHKRCRRKKCVLMKRSTAYLFVTVKTVCLTELKVSFEFLSSGLKNGEQLLLEYSSSNSDDNEWTLLKVWERGRRATGNKFKNGRRYSTSANLSLATESPSNLVLRFRSTSPKKKVFIDSLKIEGKF